MIDHQTNSTSKPLRIGKCAVDLERGTVRRDDEIIRLPVRLQTLLRFFVEHAGEVVTRDELIENVWGHVEAASDDSVNTAVSKLRRTLGDQKRPYAIIQTLPRQGYCLEPSAIGRTESERETAKDQAVSRMPLRAALGVLLMLAVFITGTLSVPRGSNQPEGSEPPRIAVLPFAALSDNEQGVLLAHGVHDDLLTRLSKVAGLRTVSRTSVLDYANTTLPISEIGTELGVDAILEGSVLVNGDRVRVNAQLIDAQADDHLWAETYDRALGAQSFFAVQADIAREVARAIGITLAPAELTGMQPATANDAAHQAFLRARALRAEGAYINDPRHIAALESATTLDPDMVSAWAELAGSLSYEYAVQRPSVDEALLSRAREAVEQTQRLGPGTVEALRAETFFAYYVREDYETALDRLATAARLAPSDAGIHELRSWVYRRQGLFEKSIEASLAALEFDPRNESIAQAARFALTLTHRHEEALALSYQFGPVVSQIEGEFLFHRDPARFADELVSTAPPEPGQSRLSHWRAQLLAGRFEAALQAARAQQDLFSRPGRTHNWELMATYWVLGEQAALDELLDAAERELAQHLDAHPDDRSLYVLTRQAEIAAFRGSGPALIEHLQRIEEQLSPLSLARGRYLYCQLLSIADQPQDSLRCLEEALVAPSLLTGADLALNPLLEPVRRLPGFETLVESTVPSENWRLNVGTRLSAGTGIGSTNRSGNFSHPASSHRD